MARVVISIFLVQCFVYEVLSSYAQPTVQQYLQLAGIPHTTQTIAVPATQHTAPAPNPATNQPRPSTGLPSFSALALPNLVASLQQPQIIQQTPPTNAATNQQRPPSGLTSFSALALPGLIASLQQLPATQPSTPPCNLPANHAGPTSSAPSYSAPAVPNSSIQTQTPAEVKSTASSVDSTLLNNLAVALQLLIVSNILNAPPPADSSNAKHGNEILISEPCYPQPVLPNSNFIGSSSFADPNIIRSYKPAKSVSLMSPYEALGSSLYSDPILSQFGSTNPRQDFQSPYTMIADSDLFSMNDLF